MSTITFKYSQSIEKNLSAYKQEIRSALIDATVEALKVDPNGVIIDFEPWGNPTPTQAPDILLRAETSIKRRELLTKWGTALLTAWKQIVAQLNLPFTELRVAAKPYVIDSEWHELEK